MSDQPGTNWLSTQRARISGLLNTPARKAAAALIGAVVAGAAAGGAWLALDDDREHTPLVEAPGFSVGPEGEDVPRLAPVKVTFANPPGEQDAEKLLKVEPAAPGSYVWLSDRTILFQPEYPGLLRGASYTVTVPARPEAGLAQEVQHQFTVTGRLTVQQVLPGDGDAEVPLNAQILVQFSRSVAPLTTLDARGNTPVIEFDPPLAGTGEWLNTSVYRFVPERLEPFTTYRLRIPKGLTSAADGVLEADYDWSFQTLSPAVAQITPGMNTHAAGPRQPVTVTFNQPMDPRSASGISVRGASDIAVPGAITWNADFTVATFTPTGQLALSTVHTVVVAAGLPGANGGATPTERRSTFTTVGLPAVSSTRPANGDSAAFRYGVNIMFTNPMDADSLEGKISVSGFSADDLDGNVYASENNLYVSVSLKPSTSYTVALAPGARDRYGQVMGGHTFSFTTERLRSSVSLALPSYSSTATYSDSVEPILYFHATNMAEARFTLYPLTAAEAKAVLQGNYLTPDFSPSLPPLRSWAVPTNGELNEIVLGSTSLTDGGPLPRGYYYVRSSGEYNSYVAFSVVDTVIVTKLAQDELLAWAIDHDTGKPIAGATIVASGEGVTPETRTTDANGMASFKVPLPTPSNPKERFYILLLDDGGHMGVGSTRWSFGSQPYQLNLPTDYYVREWVGQVYTDRPIYRPGETVEYKGIIRADDDAAYTVPPADPPLQFVITNSRGQQVVREDIRLNEFGTFAASFQIPSDAPVGDYVMVVQPRDDQKGMYWGGIASNSFLVAEFRKPEFQVEVATASPNAVAGDSIATTVTASYFFGGGVENAGVEWSVLGSPTSLRVEGYERYSFADYDYWRTAPRPDPIRTSGTATTGPDGVASFAVPATLQEGEGAQILTVSATVTDQSAQAVASSTTVTLHPAAKYAGIRPDGYVAEKGKLTSVDLVTVDTSGKVLPDQDVTVRVYRREWVTTKQQTPDGARQYKSEPKDTLVTTVGARTGANGETSVGVTPERTGTYRVVVEITDVLGRTSRSAAYIWVWGDERASWRISNDDTIALVADKESYEVGETAEILVPAPFEGAVGLVTVERGKIITREVRQFPTNTERLLIPITSGSVPDVFVSVVLYRPPTAADPVPRYKVGYVQLPVSTATRELNISIKPDREEAQPGDTVRYDISVTDSAGKGVEAEVSISVVDKALLALEEERGPDGLRAFWFERGLGVYTASSMSVSIDRSNDVIAEPPREGKGGGGLEDDRLRQDFRNSAYWSAQVKTGADGKTTVEVKMPDNLTTWRMQVRAVSGDTMVGEGSNELVSTIPLLLRPALPRFLRVGDATRVRLLVRNATGTDQEVKVSIAVEGIELEDDSTKTVKVPAGQSVPVSWPAKVTTEGIARFTFTAKGGGFDDAVTNEIPILLDVTPETTGTNGIVNGEPGVEAVYLPAWALLKNGLLRVSVQSTLTGTMSDELAEYPFRPFEDPAYIASRLIANIAVARAQKAAGGSPANGDRITSDLAALVSSQRPDGGWAWCNGPLCASDPNVTTWVLFALGEARRDGLTFDNAGVGRAGSYLSAYINRSTDVLDPVDPNHKAFMLAATAAADENHSALTPARALFEQQRAQLNNWGRAYLVLALTDSGVDRDDEQVRALLNDLAAATIPSANGNHWEDPLVPGVFMTDTATTALVTLTLARVQPEQPLLPQSVRWLVIARGPQKLQTSLERSHSILALTTYAVTTGELASDFNYRVTLDGDQVLDGEFKPGDPPKETSKEIPLSSIKPGKVSLVAFLRDFSGPGRLYYSLYLRYMTPAKEIEALNRGFAISREYSLLDDPKTKVTGAKLGDVVRVKVTIMAPAVRHYAVVEDLLPAGLEPIDARLQTTDPALMAQLDAERRQADEKQLGGYMAPWFGWYYSPWQQVEMRDDRVVLMVSRLPAGVYEYTYYARATTPGDFFIAPAHAEESYLPEVFGRSDSGRFTVAD